MAARPTGPRRIAYLCPGQADHDSRTHRMARRAVRRGDHVTIYTPLRPGLPVEEAVDGYRIVRVPIPPRSMLIRLLSSFKLGRPPAATADDVKKAARETRGEPAAGPPNVLRRATAGGPLLLAPRAIRAAVGRVRRANRAYWRPLVLFPLVPRAWARALEEVAEPHDIWHGMFAGSLPALSGLRRRHGGATVYDCRDVFLRSRAYDGMAPWSRWLLSRFERMWSHSADAVITVNDAYARMVEQDLGVSRPPVVMNCPERWDPPSPRPDLIRERLGLSARTAVVLYQGGLMTERGIEQGMDAILQIPDAVLVLLGFGSAQPRFLAMAARPPYLGRVHLLDPVAPRDLLAWTASSDVMLMAIQPTTWNHRHTTPQKLFEAMAAGVPVVASDLPGMAAIVRSEGCGVLCDPTDVASIAEAIRSLLDGGEEAREGYRQRALSAARTTYNWDAQDAVLEGVYATLLPHRAHAAHRRSARW